MSRQGFGPSAFFALLALGFILRSPPAFGQETPALQAAVLDASACGATAEGAQLLRALQVEMTASENISLRTSDDAPNPVASKVSLRITACAWKTGVLSVEIEEAPGTPVPHLLDLKAVPEVARPRTSAVALLEWLNAVSRDALGREALGGDSVQDGAPGGTAAAEAVVPSSGSNNSGGSQAPAQTQTQERSSPGITTQEHDREDFSWARSPSSLEVGIGFQLARAPTPPTLRVDASGELRLENGILGSAGLHGAALSPTSSYGTLKGGWWGGELALGYGWGSTTELSVWGVSSFDGVLVQGTTRTGSESNTVLESLISASARFKLRTLFSCGWVIGAAFDWGYFLKGVRISTLDETVVELVGLRVASRVIVGYAF